MTTEQLANHYTYRVVWSPEDGEHVGLVDEFPSLSWLADTPAAALDGIVNVVSEIIADLNQRGEDPPPPISDRDYSGKFQVRVGKERHRRLAMRAARDHKSINALILDLVDDQV